LALRVIVGGIAVAVLAVGGARVLRSGPAVVTVTLAPETVSAATSPPPTAPLQPMPTAAPSPSTTAVPQRLYTEADLMAVVPEEEQRAAVARAEWFVTDFFTVDGDGVAVEGVRGALPAGFEVVLPHEVGGGTSYVEWARALRVVPEAPGRYRVTVAYRALAGATGEPLRRSPVVAVDVEVAVDSGGATAVVDLPQPAAIDTATAEAAIPAEAEPPAEVAAAAIELARRVGDDPQVEGAGLDAVGWRVVVSVTDGSGLRWPLVVRPTR
jgi:hypothetical protein